MNTEGAEVLGELKHQGSAIGGGCRQVERRDRRGGARGERRFKDGLETEEAELKMLDSRDGVINEAIRGAAQSQGG